MLLKDDLHFAKANENYDLSKGEEQTSAVFATVCESWWKEAAFYNLEQLKMKCIKTCQDRQEMLKRIKRKIDCQQSIMFIFIFENCSKINEVIKC